MGVRTWWVAAALLLSVALATFVVLSVSPRESVPRLPSEERRGPAPKDPSVLHRPSSRRPITGAVEVRVTRAGRGVAAKIELRLFGSFEGREIRRAAADASGSFTFPAVPVGNHAIIATGADGVAVRRAFALYAGVSPTRVELRLPAGGLVLRGRAAYADGRPFTGSIVIGRGPQQDLVVAATRRDGRFTAAGLDAGRVYLGVESDALQADGPSITLPHDEEVLLVVDEGARVLHGRVVARETGAPVGGAEVTVRGRYPDDRCLTLETQTDRQGAFRVAVPVRDDRIPEVVVRAEGYRPWRLDWLPWRESLDIRLDRSPRLSVRVVAAEGGTPVPFVPVTAVYVSARDVRRSETRLTDGEGRVRFTSIPGDVVLLYARGHGWISDNRGKSYEERLLFLEGDEEREVTLEAVRSACLLGRVTTASGAPVAGASLNYDTWPVVGGMRVDPDGEFALADLLPCEFRLEANRGKLSGAAVHGSLEPGEVRRVELPLAVGAWVEVAVRAADTGEAVAGAWVEVRGRGRGTTDDAGRARLGPFAQGPSAVWVTRRGYRMVREHVDLRQGETSSLSLVMDRGLAVAGRIAFADGTPAAGARVGWYEGAFGASQETAAGEDGSFELRGLPPGEVTLWATCGDGEGREHKAQQRLPAGTGGAIVVLRPETEREVHTVEIMVTDSAGNPVPRADYTAPVISGEGAEVDEHSGYVIAGRAELKLEGGGASFRLRIHSARLPTGVPLPLGVGEFGPFPADRDRIEVVLEDERVVTGRVLDPSRRGLSRVVVRAADGPWSAWTKADGSFRLGGLGAGMVTIEVDAPEGLVQVEPTVVPAGTKGVVIELDELVPAVVTVRDPDGRPVAGAWVIARRGAREVGWGKTDREGRKRFAKLARSAPHRLRVAPERDDRNLGATAIDDWKPGDTDITLPAGRSIAGTALLPDGTPYLDEEGEIWIWSRGRGWEALAVETDGAFEERGFGPGKVALVWLPPDRDPFDEPEVEPGKLGLPVTWVEAGARDIVFRLPPR